MHQESLGYIKRNGDREAIDTKIDYPLAYNYPNWYAIFYGHLHNNADAEDQVPDLDTQFSSVFVG